MNTRHIRVTLMLVPSVVAIAQILPLSAQSIESGQSVPKGAIKALPAESTPQFVAGRYLIHSATPGLSFVQLKIVVKPDGTVSSVIPVSGNADWYEKAAALAMDWHFTSFKPQGTATYATVYGSVDIVPPEQRLTQHTSFPEIMDWSSLRITLQRTGCFGFCPSYKLTIYGDGRVVYHGDGFVEYCGEYRGHVSPDAVRQLVDLFKDADYFNLLDRYDARASDAPAFGTSIAFDTSSKSVFDYVGVFVGMPEIVRSVEDGIDRLAGPKIWAKGMDSHVECEHSFLPITTSDVPNKIE